jgi:hypothetical protein
MALSANALTTVATLAGELGISTPSGGSAAEADLERRIAVASDDAEAYCGRPFAKTTVTEKVAGFCGPVLRLSRYPLISITSVALNGSAVASSTWAATPEADDAAAGQLRHLIGAWEWTAGYQEGASPEMRAGTEQRLYAVAYVGGYVLPKDDGVLTPRTLPYQLEEACLLTCVASYRARGRDQNIVSESLLSASVTYAGSTVNTGIGRGGGIIPDNAAALLDLFKRWS